jgi:hypothetical protein
MPNVAVESGGTIPPVRNMEAEYLNGIGAFIDHCSLRRFSEGHGGMLAQLANAPVAWRRDSTGYGCA